MLRLVLSLLCVALAAGSGTAVAEELRPVLVTVDDLPMHRSLHPDPEDRMAITSAMLDTLQRHGIKAVGLVTWGNVISAADEGLLERWLAQGHELGNHSFHHPSLSSTPVDQYLADIEAARVKLAALLQRHGKHLRFFRFPFLREGETREKLAAVRAYLERTGQQNLPVTIDNQDWSFERPWIEAVTTADDTARVAVAAAYHESLHVSVRHHEASGDRLLERSTPQILLLHAGAVGAAQWDRLFTWLEQTGHRFATADEVLADEALHQPHSYVGPRGVSYWDRLWSVRRHEQAAAEITALLADQAAAWNRGDLVAFCSVYAEDALFASPRGLTRGRAQVLDRYRQSYPDGTAMGTLTLEVIELQPVAGIELSMLGDSVPSRVHGASVLARWSLAFGDGSTNEGLTLLAFERTVDGWQIRHDASF